LVGLYVNECFSLGEKQFSMKMTVKEEEVDYNNRTISHQAGLIT